ncbi:capsular polysaccharide export protein, LipB/KpsS family [Isoalcanivorax beigongshangi]|uniref:Polysaccharide synthesis/modification protein n=1 Tax=Isoalcanivorax beigongshangi TaxID=3238810 RepID=A0ABV4ADM4_9GAMM
MSNSNLPCTIFYPLSSSQDAYYRRLKQELGIRGMRVSAKRPGLVNPLPGLVYMIKRRSEWGEWLRFHLAKERANGRQIGALHQFLLLLRASYNLSAVMRAHRKCHADALMFHNGAHYKQGMVLSWAAKQGIQPIYVELGVLPNTMALDGSGVNYHNSVPRESAFYRSYVPRGERINCSLMKRPQRHQSIEEKPVMLPEKYIFVPFQVYDDSQIISHSPWVLTMESLNQVLLRNVHLLPRGWHFVVKEHPSSKIKYPHLHGLDSRIVFANQNDTQQLIENAQLIVTVNSSVGVESLLLGMPVVTLGHAFYNIDGLVGHAASESALQAYLSRPDSVPSDPLLARQFIAWLQECYLVPGRVRSWDENHIERARQRLIDIMSGSVPN